MPPPTGPTQPGARTGGWKYQAGHAFKRGQPVYLQSGARYALASLDTGFDGLVGDVKSDSFELVTVGELDGLFGLVVNQVYSLGPTPGLLVAGSEYPVMKGSSVSTALLVASNIGTTGTDIPLSFTVSVTPIPDGVPKAYPDGTIDPGWLPALPYEPLGAVSDHNADPDAHPSMFVRAPENGGVLDVDEGSLVFDVDDLTQVLDEAVF